MNNITIGRNELCPCKSSKKYKRCCFPLAFPAPQPEPKLAEILAKMQKGGSWIQVQFNHFSGGARGPNDRAIVRTGSVQRLQLNPEPTLQRPVGEVEQTEPRQIRATAEHPFYVWGRGWVPLQEIKPSEWIRADDGWTQVGEVTNTGQWEKVYNIRVADYHTYFVGGDDWGFSAWAHNADCAEQRIALRGVEERLGSMSSNANILLRNRADFIHSEVMHIAETAMQVGRSAGRGNHVGQIFKDLLQPLHKKLADLKSRFNIEIEPRVLNGRRVLGNEPGHVRLDTIITEMPTGARRPALDPKMTFETQGLSRLQKLNSLAQLETDLNYHTIIHGYDISIAHYPISGHVNVLFTTASPLAKASVVTYYTTGFAPVARPNFQVFDIRVIADQFLINGTPRPARVLVDGVLK